jgi:tetratricopeptide (TPR) repeat protein
MIYYYARQYDEALQALQKTIEMETNFIHCHGLMGLAYLEKAMFDEALIEFEKEQNIFPDWNPTAEIWIGYALAKMGKTDEVHKLLDALEKKSETEFISPYFHAGLYIIIGENDQGFLRLEQAFIEYDSWLNFMKVDPILDSVRSDSRFKILLKKMNLD